MTRYLFVLFATVGLLSIGCKPSEDRTVTNVAPADISKPQSQPGNSSSGTTNAAAEDVTKAQTE